MSECDDCHSPALSEAEQLEAAANYEVELGRAERAIAMQARESNRRCSNTHHIAAGWADGRPMVQPLGGKPYPATGQMITNASVMRGSSLQSLGCGSRFGQMTRRKPSRRDETRVPTAELAYMFLRYDDGGPELANRQRIYVGGICPHQLVYDLNRTNPLTVGRLRREAFQSALAIDDRGAILEVRKERIYPFAVNVSDGEGFPSDYDYQVNVNPDSDYYRFPYREAFLIARNGTITEIEPGTNEHIGAWTHDRKAFNLYSDPGPTLTSPFEEGEFLPGGYYVSNDVNRNNGNITTLSLTEPIIGSTISLPTYASFNSRDYMLYGTDLERQVWVCNVEPQTFPTVIVRKTMPIALKRLVGDERTPFIGIADASRQLQLSGRYTP